MEQIPTQAQRMIWGSDQQRILAALGYTLYRPAAARPEALPAPAASPATPQPATADRLWTTLRRAAGRDLSGLDLPPLEQLRRDPAAKRALWPRLRALRRGTQP